MEHEQGTVYVDESNLEVELSTKPPSMFSLFWKEIRHDPFALVSLILLVIIFLGIFIGAPIINRHMDVMLSSVEDRNISPAGFQRRLEFDFEVMEITLRFVDREMPTLLGTDELGRQIAPLMVVGARNSLSISLGVLIITYIIGLVIGLISGYYGGHIDNIIMRITDTVSMMPQFMVIMVLIEMLPRTVFWFVVILSMFGWIGRVRLIRSVALQQRNLDYIAASKTLGTRNAVIIVREMLPNMVDIAIANFVLSFAAMIGIETGLTVLGFGLAWDVPSLGALINNALQPVNMQVYWWTWMPAIILVVTIMLCINFVGNALQRVADPRQRLV